MTQPPDRGAGLVWFALLFGKLLTYMKTQTAREFMMEIAKFCPDVPELTQGIEQRDRAAKDCAERDALATGRDREELETKYLDMFHTIALDEMVAKVEALTTQERLALCEKLMP